MEKLKPCPFCGERTNLHVRRSEPLHYTSVVCDECGARVPVEYPTSDEDAIEKWNHRATETTDA